MTLCMAVFQIPMRYVGSDISDLAAADEVRYHLRTSLVLEYPLSLLRHP